MKPSAPGSYSNRKCERARSLLGGASAGGAPKKPAYARPLAGDVSRDAEAAGGESGARVEERAAEAAVASGRLRRRGRAGVGSGAGVRCAGRGVVGGREREVGAERVEVVPSVPEGVDLGAAAESQVGVPRPARRREGAVVRTEPARQAWRNLPPKRLGVRPGGAAAPGRRRGAGLFWLLLRGSGCDARGCAWKVVMPHVRLLCATASAGLSLAAAMSAHGRASSKSTSGTPM